MPAKKKRHTQPDCPSLSHFPMKLSPVIWLAVLIALALGAGQLARAGKASETRLSRLSGDISVHASGRGNPRINLSDGRDVLTSYSGPVALTRALQDNEAQPLALGSADFDEDGVPDLICGYAHSSLGIMTWLRGNVDSIYENSPDAQQRKAAGEFNDAPFLSPARAFALPINPEFVGTGDFDADGHWDVVAASRSSSALYLLPGDGTGNFGAVRQTVLPGTVTALVTGEINRRDGLEDVVVAVKGEDGAKALVFEGPDGALRAEPEVFDLPDEATALALGQLDDEYTMDLAVAAGRELMVVHGRDQKLSLDRETQATVKKARKSFRDLGFAVRSLAIGNFSNDGETSIALLSEDGTVSLLSDRGCKTEVGKPRAISQWGMEPLTSDRWPEAIGLVCARVSASASDDLVVVASGSRQLHILSGTSDQPGPSSRLRVTTSLLADSEPVAVLPMRLNEDALSDLVMLRSSHSAPALALTAASATFTVTNINGSGAGSLRQAIIDANNNAGADIIRFNIPGAGPFTIAVQSELPRITGTVTIDGYTQSGAAPNTLPNGNNAVLPIVLSGENRSSSGNGLFLDAGSSGSTIKGLVVQKFSFTGIAIQDSNNNVIQGNYIGIDSSGAIDSGNAHHGMIVIRANGNLIGGTSPAARNIISGNHNDGLAFLEATANNQVQGNYIGTNAAGTAALGNRVIGVYIERSRGNTVGGVTIQARNIISANGFHSSANFDGILLADLSEDTLVQGNFIGTNAAGDAPLPNAANGIAIGGFVPIGAIGARNSTLGGTAPGARNVISAKNLNGILLFGNSPGIKIQGNYIGITQDGKRALGTGPLRGIEIQNLQNITIGGTTPGARNVISNCAEFGLISFNCDSVKVEGNYIGVDADGRARLPNRNSGVLLINSRDFTIGGADVGARNIISGNTNVGISLFGEQTKGTVVQGNFIGTDKTGTKAVPNGSDGIQVSNVAAISGNVFAVSILGNIISANGRHGANIGAFIAPPPSTNGGAVGAGFGGRGSLFQRNFIGTDITGTIDLGNQQCGIFVENNSVSHTIEDNIIGFNKQNGICVPDNPGDPRAAGTPGFSILMSRNQIFSNTLLGIDLGTPGPTENEPANPVPGKANLRQNFPVLNSVQSEGSTTTVEGTFNGAPKQTFTIEFFSNPSETSSGCRQGRQFVSFITVNTDAKGNAPIKVILPVGMSGGFINSTATDPGGNTSEFSNCVGMNAPRAPELIKITVTSNIVAVGSGFVKPVHVFIDGVGFPDDEPARVKGGGTRVIQKGKLTDGRNIEEAVPPGKLVQIKFRNGNGTETVVPFKK